MSEYRNHEPRYEPSPGDIADAVIEIRQRWTERDWQRRRPQVRPWTAPQVSLDVDPELLSEPIGG